MKVSIGDEALFDFNSAGVHYKIPCVVSEEYYGSSSCWWVAPINEDDLNKIPIAWERRDDLFATYDTYLYPLPDDLTRWAISINTSDINNLF